MLELLFGNMPLVLLIAGLVMIALEAVSPGAHFIVIGVALAGAGLIGFILGPVFSPLAAPIVLAAMTLGIGALAAYIYREFDFYGGKGTAQTRDSSSLSGTTGYVTKTVTARDGEVKLDNGGFTPYYRARTTSGTIEEGEEIMVIDPGGGNVVTVEALGAIGEDEIDRALAREPDGDDDTGSPAAHNQDETTSETESAGEPNS